MLVLIIDGLPNPKLADCLSTRFPAPAFLFQSLVELVLRMFQAFLQAAVFSNS